MDPSQLNEILECSVCLERLDHTSKVLPCQHTFCRRCLREIAASNKELRCPECRVLVGDDVDIDELPTNILLVRILEGLSNHKRNRKSVDSEGVPTQNNRNSSSESVPASGVGKPCARALYDYEPKEQGDLKLRRGEEITLIRQVDENWYEGVVDGTQGYLPANYVEIITPLPSLDAFSGAVAKALFDFEGEEEPDLLTFKQGDIIRIIRPVDENWCEGVLNGDLGIFPLSFVELNSLAKSRIENGMLSNPGDPSSAIGESCKEPKRHTIHFERTRDQDISPQPRLRHRHSLEISSSERLAETYSRGTLLSRSAREGAAAAAGTNFRSKSASPSCEQSSSGAKPSPPNSTSSPSRRSVGEPEDVSGRKSAGGSPTLAAGARPAERSSSLKRGSPTEARRNARPASAEVEKDLYVALFNYKPQKDDEIELVKGANYYVLEKWKDGWFRGYADSTRKRGVFPGNYVRLSSIHNLLTKARSNSGGQELEVAAASNQHQQQQQQQPPQQYQRRDRNSTGSIAAKPRFRQSESAPPCPPVPVKNLVVNLDSRDAESRVSPSRVAGEASARPVQHPALPPPPAPKTSSFWRKLKGKKKDKPKPLPPPPYHRYVPAGHAQLSLGQQGVHPTLPSYLQATREESRGSNTSRRRQRVENAPARERYRVNVAYPAQNEAELELHVGDIVYVAKKRQDGWFKGTLERNGKTGLFPGSFVELF